MKKNVLLTPGPTYVPQRLREVLGQPIIHHRTPQFQTYLKEAIDGLQYVLKTMNDVYVLASSGTGAMEACVCSLVSSGDKVITVEGGKFGERWTELCRTFGADPYVIAPQWGSAVSAQEIADVLEQDPSIKAVFITLCETSTGAQPDIQAIGEVVARSQAVLVVDGISGLGVVDFQMDFWQVDVVAGASHKGLMLPPGLSFVSMSVKAKRLMQSASSPAFYFNLRRYEKAYDSSDTPFTPATSLVIALVESLRMIREKGLENLFLAYERLAAGVRKGVEAMGLTVFTQESARSNVLTAVCLPDGIAGGEVVKRMRDDYGVTVAGGQGPLKGKIIRIAHMGVLTQEDSLAGLAALENVLKDLGYQDLRGVGVEAAKTYFEMS